MNKIYLILGILICMGGQSLADVRLPALFSSDMVLQRNTDLRIWGWAAPGERVSIDFHNKTYKTKADKAGKWSVSIGNHPAGGPYVVTVKGQNIIRLQNVMVGDVWICSGQSNMAWGLSGDENAERAIAEARYPNMRLFNVERDVAQQPKEDVGGTWKACSPATAAKFSAVAYYFGREIHVSQEVPVGLIQASWGGSAIISWMSADGFEDLPQYHKDLELLASGDDYISIKSRNFNQEKLEPWFQQLAQQASILTSPESVNPEAVKDAPWTRTRVPQTWEKTPVGEFDGLVWYKTSFDLGDDLLDDEKTYLSLGRLDDQDVIYLNGVRIGHAGWKEWSRYYELPDTLLQPGENELLLGIIDYGGDGGFSGSANDLYIESKEKDGKNIRYPLPKEWYYFSEGAQPQIAPTWLGAINEPTMLYNAMLAPITSFPVKGVIWYQGERSKSSPEGYDIKLKSMIKDWRELWQREDLPFLFVQLPNYENEKGQYPDDNWPLLRSLQAKALELPRTGMAVTYDVGDPNDIHPVKKEPVGHRLALAARYVAYGEDVVYSGPQWSEVTKGTDEIRIRFETLGSEMLARDPYGYLRGFEVGYMEEGKLQVTPVQAVIVGDEVVIRSGDLRNPEVVRYAWKDNPDANLYNEDGLPAPPFAYWFE